MVKMVLMVQLVHQVLVDLMDPLEFRDQQEQLVVLDHKVSKVHLELGYALLIILTSIFSSIPSLGVDFEIKCIKSNGMV